MRIAVHLRDRVTGQRRVYNDPFDYPADEPLIAYLFGGGNYGCDCNRALFYARAANEDDPDVPCGEERYEVERVERVEDFGSGQVLYRDADRITLT